ncbi:hypothetical protein [Nonomuraea phyllanthi]|uniref:hypothetical protein n=1 Tax=Nonomuraea phyllanthi TaxID=2219224 RepID=UPI00186B33B1|nr:hypothetical protein [Nonomuraea phyllanthi]
MFALVGVEPSETWRVRPFGVVAGRYADPGGTGRIVPGVSVMPHLLPPAGRLLA